MSLSSKLSNLHNLLHYGWTMDNAARQARQTARVLQLLDDEEVQKSIAEGKDMNKEGSDVTLLHACARSPDVPLQIPLRLLALGADPHALSMVKVFVFNFACLSFRPALKRMDVLASAVRHRAAQTQIALLTCPKLQLIRQDAKLAWSAGGYVDGQEYAGVWPTQHENQMEGDKQSLWWRDNLDAAFRYIFLARERYVQPASGHAPMCIPLSIEQAMTREWINKASGYWSVLALIEQMLSNLRPHVLQLADLLMTKSVDAAKDYAHGRRAAQRFSAAEMAKAILQRVKDEAPPAYKKGDTKSDPNETAEERAEAAWTELQRWRTLITPAFKHIFSRIPIPVYPHDAPADADKWAPESDDDAEDEDEDDTKDSAAAAKECCEEKEAEDAKEETEQKEAVQTKLLVSSVSSTLALAPNAHHGDDEEAKANDRLSSAYSFIDADAQSTRSSIESADESDAAAADESDLPPTDLPSLRQTMTLAQAAVTATESKLEAEPTALARCKTNVREAVQRTIQQKLDEAEQLRHELVTLQ